MKAHETAAAIAKEYAARTLHEADTRVQVIDPILFDVLGWPRNRVSTEALVRPGYADYVLYRPDGGSTITIEAKREGRSIPRDHSGSVLFNCTGNL